MSTNITDTLNKRLNYAGGIAENRFINDKLKGLKKALIYSYQACTAVLSDGREFRCLLNPNKLKADYDIKILSIPFEDIRLNSDAIVKNEDKEITSIANKTSGGVETIGMKCGDIFTWKETNSKWLVYSRYIEEDAYFRADVIRCDQQCRVSKDGELQWCYIRGPVETNINWNQKGEVEYNSLNYSLVMYIPKTEENLKALHRFAKIEVVDNPIYNTKYDYNYYQSEGFKNNEDFLDNKDYEKTELHFRPWKVAAVDPYYYDGVIQVMLDEEYQNTPLDERLEEIKAEEAESEDTTTQTGLYIDGPDTITLFDTGIYEVKDAMGGTWSLTEDKHTVRFEGDFEDTNSVTVEVLRLTKAQKFTLTFVYEDVTLTKEISIGTF